MSKTFDITPWNCGPAHDPRPGYVQRLRDFPRRQDRLTYALRSAAALTVRAYLKTYHRIKILGRENLPADGSFVLVSNHGSHLDALCLLSALPLSRLDRAFPLAAADYFCKSMPRLLVTVLAVNALPFGRQTHVRQSLSLCRQLLSKPGNILIIFPEGTRRRDESIGEFKRGIGKLVGGTNVAVVPCYIDGAKRAMPKGRWIPLPRAITLTIGKPRRFRDAPAGREGADKIANELRKAVVNLSR